MDSRTDNGFPPVVCTVPSAAISSVVFNFLSGAVKPAEAEEPSPE